MQRPNFQGANFRNRNLAGANFRNADIRGADFSHAILSGANFHNAKAGLSTVWAIGLVTLSLILALFAGLISAYASALISDLLSRNTYDFGMVSLITLAIFLIVIFYQGLGATVVILAELVAACLATIALIPNEPTGENLALGAQFTALALAGAMTGIGNLAIAVAIARVIALPQVLASTGIMAVLGAMLGVLLGTKNEPAYLIPGGIALATIACSVYIGWQAINGEKKYWLIQAFVIAMVARGGTRFHSATLIDADFTKATLKTADFRKATLTRTCWFQAQKLDQARVEGTYLQNPKVRQLVVTKDGWDQSFDHLNLRGLNLQNAYLQDASFISVDLSEANLRNANLSIAKLVQTQLDEAKLAGACLTGACLENVNITSNTELNNVICDYIYLQYPDKERRPSSGKFAPGDFTKYYHKALKTVDLIFRNGIDWQAFFNSFQKLRVEHGSDDLSIQSIENKNNGDFVIRVNIPLNTNDFERAEIERYLKQEYKRQLKSLNEKYKYQLRAKDNEIAIYRKHSADLTEMVKVMASRRIKNVIKVTTKSKFMSELRKVDINQSNSSIGVGYSETVHTNQLGGTNHNYASEREPTLAEAAAEIQQLLTQLEETNPTATEAEKQAFVNRAIPPTRRERFLNALQAGWKEALKEFLDNPYLNVGIAVLEGWKAAE